MAGDGVFDDLRSDHRRIELLLTRLEQQAETTPKSVLDAAARQVSAHLSVTISALYPVVVTKLHGGDDLAKKHRLGAEEVQITLQRLQRTPLSTEEFREELGRFIAAVRRQMANEESQVLAVLPRELSDAEAADLVRQLRRARRRGVIRPHPHIPKSALGASVATRIMGTADRVRERLQT